MPEPRTGEAFLGARVDELDGHWLEIECACGIRVMSADRTPRDAGGAEIVDGAAPSPLDQCFFVPSMTSTSL